MAYDANNTYCTIEDVQAYLTGPGLAFAVDAETTDGVADADEIALAETAIDYANSLADEAIQPFASISPRQKNDWLKHRVVDIAAYRLMTLCGRSASEELKDAYQDAVNRLELVRQGGLDVPGLSLNSPVLSSGRRGQGLPVVFNPSPRRRW